LHAVITFENVSKRFGERLALDDVSWQMDEGESVAFLGPNGSGKTTLLRLITHEIQPTSGRVTVGTFQSRRLRRGHRALLRRTLGIIYEDFRLLNDRSVFENVALAVRIAGRFSDEEVIPRVLYALEEVGLQLKQHDYPAELSAGERLRAAIARAIVNRPAVILADEPTGALEKKSSEDIVALLRRIHAEGAALLVVTTRPHVAEGLGTRLIRIDDGKLVDAEGRPLTGASVAATRPAPAPAPAPALEAAPQASLPPSEPLAPAPALPPADPGSGA
jgi:ABC-type ATPase involved in cell division